MDDQERWELNEKLARLLNPEIKIEWRWCRTRQDGTIYITERENPGESWKKACEAYQLPCTENGKFDELEVITDFAGSFEGMEYLIKAMNARGWFVRSVDQFAEGWTATWIKGAATHNATDQKTLPEAVAVAALPALEAP